MSVCIYTGGYYIIIIIYVQYHIIWDRRCINYIYPTATRGEVTTFSLPTCEIHVIMIQETTLKCTIICPYHVCTVVQQSYLIYSGQYSILAALGMLQPWTFGSLNHVDSLDSVSNWSSGSSLLLFSYIYSYQDSFAHLYDAWAFYHGEEDTE